MAPLAAVMTGPGPGAIATIQLFGASIPPVLQQLFIPVGGKSPALETGRLFLGRVRDVDQVTIGCEAPQTFSIHCHGNPLIVQAIVKQLEDLGVEIVSARQLLAATWTAGDTHHPIAIEARLALTTVKTIEGAALIENQVQGGLIARALQWERCLSTATPETIRHEAAQILSDSRTARLVIEGCIIALIGPPNTGKSTLLNALAGRERAIVTDTKGTTRDWVSADIHIPPLAATIIDTAGLDPVLAAAEGAIAQAAQDESIEVLQQADLVLLVLDNNRPADQVDPATLESLIGRRVVGVLNKADLPVHFSLSALPNHLQGAVPISARQCTGLRDLIAAIHQACGVAGFDLHTPIAFTPRQRILLEQLSSANSSREAQCLVAELVQGNSASY
jgi:tRNA modification GTPase